MLKKVGFRSISFLIVCVLLFSSIAVPASASDGWQTDFKLPKWTHIVYVGGGVYQTTDSSGRHKVGGEVILLDGDNTAKIEATVQHYNGGWYNTSYKWSDSGKGDAEVVEYKKATGFEALIGYLYITKKIDRLEEIIKLCIKIGGGENGK